MAEKATYQGVELIRQTELEVRTIERERSGTSWTRNEKFDKDGIYVRKYCPEINKLPNQYIHKPWEAPEPMLHEYGIELGKNYPRPLVNLKESRSEALDKYRELSSN